MVFEKIFAGVANQFLGSYIENIDSKDMSFGLGGIILYVVATFTPRSSHISNARFTHSLLLASSLAAGRRQAQCNTGQVRRSLLLCVDSLLNRCYLLVSGSVRVRARTRVSARVTVRDRNRI